MSYLIDKEDAFRDLQELLTKRARNSPRRPWTRADGQRLARLIVGLADWIRNGAEGRDVDMNAIDKPTRVRVKTEQWVEFYIDFGGPWWRRKRR